MLLEYLKLFLSSQVVIGVVAATFMLLFKNELRSLLNRIASIKIGSTVLSAPQPETKEEKSKKITVTENVELPKEVNVSDPEVEKALQHAFQAERARAHLWEYRYLNNFLVLNTQKVLDWLISVESPPTFSMYDAWWNQIIPTAQERRAVINALEEHNLVAFDNELVNVTPKGHEYAEWRGSIPNA